MSRAAEPGQRSVWLITAREDLRRFLVTLLESNGFLVHHHVDAPAALSALGRTDLPDVIVSEDPPPGLPRGTIEARVRELAPFIRCLFLEDSEGELKPDEVRRFVTDGITLNPSELLDLLGNLTAEPAADLTEDAHAGVLGATKGSLLKTIGTFVGLIERYEFVNGGNGVLVEGYASEVAKELGLSTSRVEAVSAASLLYDIGMMRIRPDVKLKAGSLSSEELEIVRQHPRYSAEFCESLELPWDVSRYVLHHHERYDGTGYPDGLVGRTIPIGARIISVGDAYFAMISKRSNRDAMSEEDAIAELQRGAGTQFDPEVVEVFSSLIQVRFLGDFGSETDRPPKRIALVDDDRELPVLLEGSFTGLNYELRPIADQTGVLAELIEMSPEAIMVNADAAWIDPFQLLHRIRQEPRLGAVPVIFMGSHGPTSTDPGRALSAGADDFVVRPCSLQDLVAAVTGAIRKKSRVSGQDFVRPPTTGGVRGRLKEMGLTEICQVLSHGFKTARVSIGENGSQGQLFFKDGKLKHAEYGELAGSDAFYALLRLADAEFSIEHGISPPAETVKERLEYLLMEGMRLIDEQGRVEAS